MREPIVYCIVITYNGMQWIRKCMESLLNSTIKINIIVIDNGSHDETTSIIKINYPTVELIKTGRNLGFGHANNIGFKKAIQNKADYIFLLNQDAWIEPDTISTLVEAHKQKPQYGILSPIHLDSSGNGLDINFYTYLLESDIKELLTNAITNQHKNQLIVNTSFVNAAAWLISMECLLKTGGFDPVFFHYGEDDNYAQRVLHKGFKIGILNSAYIYHNREEAFKKIKTNEQVFKKDWIIFLNQACDVQQPQYKKVIIKRFMRYLLLLPLSILSLNKNNIIYNFSMVKNISLFFFKIKASRKISTGDNMPHL